MPDYFTHTIAADRIYEQIGGNSRKLITSRALYILGAQGGDVFFAYNMKLSRANLGRELHAQKADELFKKLLSGNKCYLAGWATHYALDSTIHPIVYAFEEGKRMLFAHQKFESDVGLYASKFYRTRRTILPRDMVLACTGAVYDSIKQVVPTVTLTGVERCLKRHFDYTRYLYRTKRQTYRCEYDFSLFAGVLEEAVELGVKAVQSVLAGEVNEELFCKAFLQRE